MRDVVSYSELSLLASCEKWWSYRYIDRIETERTPALRRGTSLHSLVGAWWIGGDAQLAAEDDFEREVYEAFHSPDEADTIRWLYDRYQQHYGRTRYDRELRVAATELRLVAPLPSSGVEVVTYLDQLVQFRKGLWIVERKSMNDWRRLNSLEVDPQVGIEVWNARANGIPVVGVLYDAIKTYRWKRDDHPPADSFKMELLTRDTEQLADVAEEMRAAVRRRALLAAGERPLRNIGSTCDRCPFRDRCWEGATFDLDDVQG